jgi:hypothetical protein
MLRVRIKMRSGASTAFPQSTTFAKEVGVGRSSAPPSFPRSPVRLIAVCKQADLSRCLTC